MTMKDNIHPSVPEEGDPEIESVTVTAESSLQAPVEADTKVATIKATGGTAPYTYKLKGTSENFKVEETEVKTAKQIDGEVTETVNVTVTDSKQKTKDGSVEIKITASEAV